MVEEAKGTAREGLAAERAATTRAAGEAREVLTKAYTPPPLEVADIKRWINPLATDEEAYTFLQICRTEELNPFVREAYLIKYKAGDPASYVVNYLVFMKRAERNPTYMGFTAGIVVIDAQKQVTHRPGAFYLPGEQIVGGWCEVRRSDRVAPIYAAVSYEEYVGRKADGTITKQWATKPGTMIQKVAVGQAHRQAFPDKLGRLYLAEEMGQAAEELPEYEVGKHPTIALPEGATFRAPEKKGTTPPGSTQVSSEGKDKGEAGKAPQEAGTAAGGGETAQEWPAPNGNPPAPPGEQGRKASEAQVKAIQTIFSKLGVKDEAERHLRAEAVLSAKIESFTELGLDQAKFLISYLDNLLQSRSGK